MERMRVLHWSVRFALALMLAVAVVATMLPQQTLAAPIERASASYVYHTVRPGDTLSRIAEHYDVSMSSIMRTNGITNPNHIYVGQRLKIPTDSVGCAFYHTVTRGQTLSGIAVHYGVRLSALAEANGISHTSYVYVGQKLCIPGSGGPAPSPEGFYYTVRPGDTLSSLAYQYGTSVAAIMNANGISHPNRVLAGQTIFIPGYYTPPVQPPKPHPTPTPKPPTPAPAPVVWTGLYYNNTDFSGAPTIVRQDAAIDFNWGFGSPAVGINNDQFSVLWTTTPYFNEGNYRFFATSDDGVRIFVDDRLIVDGWGVHPAQGYFGDVYLAAGYHSIRVEYFEQTENALINVSWSRR